MKVTVTIVQYARGDGLERAYQCTHCGYLLISGTVGAESNGDIVCKDDKQKCPQCAHENWVPLLWRSVADARKYFEAKYSEDDKAPIRTGCIDLFEVCYIDKHMLTRHLH